MPMVMGGAGGLVERPRCHQDTCVVWTAGVSCEKFAVVAADYGSQDGRAYETDGAAVSVVILLSNWLGILDQDA